MLTNIYEIGDLIIYNKYIFDKRRCFQFYAIILEIKEFNKFYIVTDDKDNLTNELYCKILDLKKYKTKLNYSIIPLKRIVKRIN